MVLFQPKAEDTRTLDSGLYLELFTLVPLMAVVPPLSPPLRFPRPSSMSTSHFARACIPLSPPLASSLSVFCLVVVPSVAPVVTRRPPELIGGRCHAAPVVLSKCTDDDYGRAPPRPVGLAVLGLVVGGEGLGAGAPPQWS